MGKNTVHAGLVSSGIPSSAAALRLDVLLAASRRQVATAPGPGDGAGTDDCETDDEEMRDCPEERGSKERAQQHAEDEDLDAGHLLAWRSERTGAERQSPSSEPCLPSGRGMSVIDQLLSDDAVSLLDRVDYDGSLYEDTGPRPLAMRLPPATIELASEVLSYYVP